ncbi:hypothetical protein L2E82_25684 [Cichorium intybus]|uniref:Uncharacterized protein n=1 Tax=Cichorium intybus TaxID=13427 RepID=A0ACB9E4L3_CICIN|nr:hypothetical protein L2E82_25684 [Cichorium intybus]
MAGLFGCHQNENKDGELCMEMGRSPVIRVGLRSNETFSFEDSNQVEGWQGWVLVGEVEGVFGGWWWSDLRAVVHGAASTSARFSGCGSTGPVLIAEDTGVAGEKRRLTKTGMILHHVAIVLWAQSNGLLHVPTGLSSIRSIIALGSGLL